MCESVLHKTYLVLEEDAWSGGFQIFFVANLPFTDCVWPLWIGWKRIEKKNKQHALDFLFIPKYLGEGGGGYNAICGIELYAKYVIVGGMSSPHQVQQ